jgi:hypothetical protein
MDAAQPVLQKETGARVPESGTDLSRQDRRETGQLMKHPSSRKFFAYWDDRRGAERAPDRSDIEPGPMRELLGDIFVLGYDHDDGSPFRVAGTRVCALLGRDLKGQDFSALFTPGSRREIGELIGIVAEELLAIVAGVTARAEDGSPVNLELLLLPFNTRPHAPLSLSGLLVPLSGGHKVLSDFNLASWRALNHPPRFHPRVLRKWPVARGFMVYEGLR